MSIHIFKSIDVKSRRHMPKCITFIRTSRKNVNDHNFIFKKGANFSHCVIKLKRVQTRSGES